MMKEKEVSLMKYYFSAEEEVHISENIEVLKVFYDSSPEKSIVVAFVDEWLSTTNVTSTFEKSEFPKL